MPALEAHFVDRDKINALLTKRYAPMLTDPKPVTVHPDVWRFHPTGNRLLVMLDPTPETWGGIVTTAGNKEQMGIGVIIAVGPDCGGPAIPYPGGPQVTGAQELLYREVVFGASSGKPLRLDYVRDRLKEYSSSVLVMADRDLWCVNWAPLEV